MLIYSNQRARFWHAQTKELWRSASVDKAKELLGQGTWIDMYDTFNSLDLFRDALFPQALGKLRRMYPAHGLENYF